MGTPLRYGDHVSFPDIPEAVGVVCENPLGPYGILPQGNIEGKTVLLRAAPRDPK